MAKRKRPNKAMKTKAPHFKVIFMGTALEDIRAGQVVTVLLELPGGNTFMRPASTLDAVQLERGEGNS